MDDDKETCVETVQDVRDRGGGGKGRDGEVAKDGGGDQGEDGSDGRQPAVHILHNMLPIRYQNYFSHIKTLLLPFTFTLFQHTQPYVKSNGNRCWTSPTWAEVQFRSS